MTKSDTLSEIMRINPTVSAAFLAEFSAEQLSEYLHRLAGLSTPKSSYPAMQLASPTRRQPAVAAGAA